MNNKKLLIIGGVILLLVLILGGIILISSNKKAQDNAQFQAVSQDETMQALSAKDLGLTFTARSDKKAVKFNIANASDITSVDYEISYTAAGDIPRGAIGHVEPKNGVIETNYIDLGTCSSGKCKYDEGVTSVKLVLKITKTNGTTYSSEASLDL